MNARTAIGVVGVIGLAAFAVNGLSFQSQDRQYKKTLQYMHDGREKLNEKMTGPGSMVDRAKKTIKDTTGLDVGGEMVEGRTPGKTDAASSSTSTGK